MRTDLKWIYVLAQTSTEADWLGREGYGYASRAEAKAALRKPEMDPHYRNLLKIYKMRFPVGEHERET